MSQNLNLVCLYINGTFTFTKFMNMNKKKFKIELIIITWPFEAVRVRKGFRNK